MSAFFLIWAGSWLKILINKNAFQIVQKWRGTLKQFLCYTFFWKAKLSTVVLSWPVDGHVTLLLIATHIYKQWYCRHRFLSCWNTWTHAHSTRQCIQSQSFTDSFQVKPNVNLKCVWVKRKKSTCGLWKSGSYSKWVGCMNVRGSESEGAAIPVFWCFHTQHVIAGWGDQADRGKCLRQAWNKHA